MRSISNDADRSGRGFAYEPDRFDRVARPGFEIDDDQTGVRVACGRDCGIASSRERHRGPGRLRHRANLRAEQQVVNDRDDHGKMIPDMIIRTAAAPAFFKNGYLVACDRTREAVLIDPGDEAGTLLEAVTRERMNVKMILLTHAHLDHITGVAAAKRQLGIDVDVWLHRDDEFLYNGVVEQGRMFGLRVEEQPRIDRYYEPGEQLAFGDLVVDVLHTPGHCPGGVCLAIGPAGGDARDLFVGDTLFAGSIGRTDLPGGDTETLLQSIRTVLFSFPDETVVHSGHGPATTIGEEKRTNPFLT